MFPFPEPSLVCIYIERETVWLRKAFCSLELRVQSVCWFAVHILHCRLLIKKRTQQICVFLYEWTREKHNILITVCVSAIVEDFYYPSLLSVYQILYYRALCPFVTVCQSLYQNVLDARYSYLYISHFIAVFCFFTPLFFYSCHYCLHVSRCIRVLFAPVMTLSLSLSLSQTHTHV